MKNGTTESLVFIPLLLLLAGAFFSSPAQAQNPRDLTNLGVTAADVEIVELRTPGSGLQVWMTMVLDEGSDTRDYNGDGDTRDEVAHLMNLRSGELINLGVAVGRIRMTGRLVILGVSEVDQGGTDLDGDGVVRGQTLHVYDLTTRELTNLGVRAGNFQQRGRILPYLVREEEVDLNGDGDLSDTVFHVYDLELATSRNLGLDSPAIYPNEVSARLICMAIREFQQGHTDLNGDGDALDTVMHVYDAQTGEIRNLGVARPDPDIFSSEGNRVEGPLLFFFGSEDDQGETDLNGDGDHRDTIPYVYDARDGSLTNLGLAYPQDPFLGTSERILGDLIIFDVSELDQGFTDLNGDGDFADRVVHIYDAARKRIRSVGLAGHGRVAGRFFAIDANEIESHLTDFNRDGDFFDNVLHLLDPVTGTLLNLELAVETLSAFGDGDLVAFKVDEEAQGETDFDGNGVDDDPDKTVVFVWNAATGESTNLGVVIDAFDPNSLRGRGRNNAIVRGKRVYLPVSEAIQGEDLNGNGDLEDNVFHLYESTTGVTVNLGFSVQDVAFGEHALAFGIRERTSTGDLNGDGDLRDTVLHLSRFDEPYGLGSVNRGQGAVTSVLRIGGKTGTVTVPSRAPVDLTLDAPPAGPSGRYILWAWRGRPSHEVVFQAGQDVLGRLVNPSPLQAAGAGFGPLVCLGSPGLPPILCRGIGVQETGPPAVPFTLSLARGLENGINLTVQGLIEDTGAANPRGWSVTNAVVIQARDL